MTNATRLPAMFGFVLLAFLLSCAHASAQSIIRCGWEVEEKLVTRGDTIFHHGELLPEDLGGCWAMQAVFVECPLLHTVTNADDLGEVVDCLRGTDKPARIDPPDNVQSYRTLPPGVTKSGDDAAIVQATIVADSIGFCPGADHVSDPFAAFGGRNPWNGPFRDPLVGFEDISDSLRLAGWHKDYADLFRPDNVWACGYFTEELTSTDESLDSIRHSADVAPSPIAGHRQQLTSDGITVFWDDDGLTLPFAEIDPSNSAVSFEIVKTGSSSCHLCGSVSFEFIKTGPSPDHLAGLPRCYRFGLPQRVSPIGASDRPADNSTEPNSIVKMKEVIEVDSPILDRPRRDTTGRFVTIRDVYPQSALFTSFTLPLIVPYGDDGDPETITSPDPIHIISPGAQTDPVATEENPSATPAAIPPAPGLD